MNNEYPVIKSLNIPARSDHGGKAYKTSGVNSVLTPKEFKKQNKRK